MRVRSAAETTVGRQRPTHTIRRKMRFINRGDRIRTCGLVVPNHTLYQAELRPGFTMPPEFTPSACGLTRFDTRALCVIPNAAMNARFAKFGFWFSGYFYPTGHFAF